MKMEKENLKSIVKEKYGQIALKSEMQTGCCGSLSSCCEPDYSMFSENYDHLQGYNPDADLGLGCGIPTEFAAIRPGQHVLDLGSGAGNDCFVARAIVGETGKVTGLDFSGEMLEKARINATKLGYSNVIFEEGDIEEMPFENDSFDVIISNCVLNLVPDKQKAFSEMKRVLKNGGHFCVSDVVVKGELPENMRKDAEMYAGCVAGAMKLDDYLDVIKESGYKNIQVHKQRQIEIPADILKHYLSEAELAAFSDGTIGLFSITVSAFK
jgi:arsenite methyltransferase